MIAPGSPIVRHRDVETGPGGAAASHPAPLARRGKMTPAR